MSLLTTMKGIPLAYNKDMQEDKELSFDAMETVQKAVSALFDGMLATMTFRQGCHGHACLGERRLHQRDRTRRTIWWATGVPVPGCPRDRGTGRAPLHREGHVRSMICAWRSCGQICPAFEEDVYEAISMDTCVNKRLTVGAPGKEAMEQVIAAEKKYLEEEWKPLETSRQSRATVRNVQELSKKAGKFYEKSIAF